MELVTSHIFLQDTQCNTLSIDNFTFNPRIRLNIVVSGDDSKAKSKLDDFAAGKEDVKIPIVNAINTTERPDNVCF